MCVSMKMVTKSTRISGRKRRPTRQLAGMLMKTATKVSCCSFSLVMCLIIRLAANGGAIPFNTQFFHDDYDDGPGFDDDGDAGEPLPDIDAGEQDLLAATAGQTRRVRPEFVNYAKRAKRVDVRKLKDNIWRGLDITIAEAKVETDGDESMVCLFLCREKRTKLNHTAGSRRPKRY